MLENLMLNIMLLGYELINYERFFEMLTRFLINISIATIIIRGIYYPIHKRKDYLFTYFLFNILIFFVCIILSRAELKLGFAFGLFAIFGILRYRTEELPIKEMTYLFMIISIALANSLSDKQVSIIEIAFVNGIIVITTFLLEKVFLIKYESRKIIEYEKIELIKPENHKKLIADLKQRTGLNVKRVQVGKIDFFKNTCKLIVFYSEKQNIFLNDTGSSSISNKNE